MPAESNAEWKDWFIRQEPEAEAANMDGGRAKLQKFRIFEEDFLDKNLNDFSVQIIRVKKLIIRCTNGPCTA